MEDNRSHELNSSKKISSHHFMEPKGLGYFANNLLEDSLFMEEGDFVGHP